MSKINFRDTVSINELRKMIPIIGEEITPIILSEPGCGKTSLLAAIALDNGDQWNKPGDSFPDDKYDYIYVDCPVKDMSDIGMTIPVHATKSLEYYVAGLFNILDKRPKVILLDEYMKSNKLMQVVFTRLVLERMVGDVPLPIGSYIFGTSNNASDGVGDSLLAHAGNRVCILHMAKPTASQWLVWATEKHIARPIRAWVTMYPRALASYLDGGQEDNPYIFNPKTPALSFCSPRSLAKCDVIVRNVSALSENSVKCALAGTIGASAAKDLATFVSIESTLVDVKEVIKSPKTVAVPKEIAAQVMMMLQAVDTIDTQDDLSSFMEFVKRIESEEIQAIFFTLSMNTARMVKMASRNELIKEWAKNHHELVAV
jgi:hypothetical protein